MSVDRSWSVDYLQKQHDAIKWLNKQGITPEEIRELRWGKVDDGDKTFSITTEVVYLQYDIKSNLCKRESYKKEFKVPLLGTECEWFFLRSKQPCPWMFTREKPKTWRREGSKESLYSLSDIQKICGKLALDKGTTVLTNVDLFANIEVSKLNVTKMKTEELKRRAIRI